MATIASAVPFVAEKGILDLREYDFPERGPLLLKGDWEFHWDALIPPAAFGGPDPARGEYRMVPGNWKNYTIRGGRLPITGSATYRLRVATNGREREFGLRLKRIYSAYRLYINGALAAENGVVGRGADDTEARLAIKTVFFDTYTTTIEIVLQVANPYYHRAGILIPPELGTQEQISRKHINALATDLFLLGVICIMAAYFFVLFLMMRERSSLYFSAFCAVVGLRAALITGERFLYHVFPAMSLRTDMVLQTFAIYLLIPSFLAFLYHIFLRRSNLGITRFIAYVSLLFLVADLLTLPRLSGRILTLYYPFLLFGLAYMAFVIISSIRKRESEAYMEGFGFLFILFTAVHDMLVDREILHSDYILPLGLLCFIFVQAVILSRRFSSAFGRLKGLLEENWKITEVLESRVEERTADIRKMNESLVAARIQAEEASSAKSRFLANMSHEMRTPLNGVLGYAELIQETDPKVIHHGYAGKIIEESRNLLGLINHLLDLSKIEAEKLTLDLHPFDFYGLVESVRDILSPLAAKKQLEFQVVLGEGIPRYIIGDASRLRQILVNLGGNAIKFTRTGGVKIRVEQQEQERNVAVILFVIQDTGIGIPRNFQTRIFERFTQAQSGPSRLYGGTGLGTTIAKQLVELMNGTIDLFSEEGKGSTFWVSIPFPRTGGDGCSAQTEEIPEPASPAASLKGKTILLVEDYPATQRITRHHLESEGARVIVADNGREGLHCFENNEVDCILMDVHMPGMDGLEATRVLRGFPGGGQIPVIGMTASAFAEDVKACIEAGMTDVLTKPLRKNELIKRLRHQICGVLGYADFLRELDGDSETAGAVLDGFLRQMEERLPLIRDAVARDDLAEVRAQAHALKGGALNIFAGPLAESAARLETAAKSGAAREAGEVFTEMLKSAEDLKKVIHELE